MISICILTKNASQTLEETLDSTLSFPEVVLLDNGSTDQTLEIAKKFPHVKIFQSPFLGFGALRNKAAALASFDWILALDSDETLSPALVEEVLSLDLDEATVYRFWRKNYYNGKWIKGCGWHPDTIYRLYHRKRTKYKEALVHESLKTENMKKKYLKAPIFHTPYRSTEEFLQKMQHYSTLFAKEHKHQKSSSFFKALTHGFFAFFKSYILKRGIFLGKEGFTISVYNGNTAFYKYLKLTEKCTKSS